MVLTSIMDLKYGNADRVSRAAGALSRAVLRGDANFEDEYKMADAVFDILKECVPFEDFKREAAANLAVMMLSSGTESMCGKATGILAHFLEDRQGYMQGIAIFKRAFGQCSAQRKGMIRGKLMETKSNYPGSPMLVRNLEFVIFASRMRTDRACIGNGQRPLY